LDKLERFSTQRRGQYMARGHLIVVLWLGVAAASQSAASEARRLSKDGSTAAFPPVPRTHGHGWYQSDAAALDAELRGEVRKLVPRDLVLYLHGLHLLEETSKKCERATGMRVLCPAKVEKMWATALKDACAVDNNAGEAYNHTCT
jgi:hypothetical protein